MAWTDPKSLTTTELEEGSDLALDFGRFFSASGNGVVPVVAQDVESRDVLVLAHANRELRWTTRCEKALRPSGACPEIVSG